MKIKCICLHCLKEFERDDYHLKNNGKTSLSKMKGVFCGKMCNDSFRAVSDLNKDQFTGFRNLLETSKRRGKEHSLTLEEMKEVWDKQKGICPYTGFNLKLFGRKSAYKAEDGHLAASLDRKDSLKGYTKDNIQFVSLMANYAKHRFSENIMTSFCKQIAFHWKDK